jgi:hypothetical protein
MIENVEQAADIEFENPVIPPASLTRYPNGIQRRFARPIAIGIIAEDRIKPWLQPHLRRRLRDPVGYCRHGSFELHIGPVSLWDRPRSLTPFIPFEVISLMC